MMLAILDFLYLDGYNNLWEKYSDPFRDIFRQERHWVEENFNNVFRQAFRNKDFKTCRDMKRYRKYGMYINLYNLMIDITGGDIGKKINLELIEEIIK